MRRGEWAVTRVVVAVFIEPAGRPRDLGRGAAASLVFGCVGPLSAPSATSVRLFARLPRICAVRFTTRRAFRGLPHGRGWASTSRASAFALWLVGEALRSSLIAEGLASACSPSEFSSLAVFSWKGLRSSTWTLPADFLSWSTTSYTFGPNWAAIVYGPANFELNWSWSLVYLSSSKIIHKLVAIAHSPRVMPYDTGKTQ